MKLKPPHPACTDLLTLPPIAGGLQVDPGAGTGSPGSIPAQLLFQGSQEILIDHNGETYRLRITKNDKLILTK